MNRESLIQEIKVQPDHTQLTLSDIKLSENQDTIPIIRKKLITTTEFVDRFRKNLYGNVNMNILPRNCRYSEVFSSGHKVYVIEDSPKVRTVTTDFSLSGAYERVCQAKKIEEYGLQNFDPLERPHTLRLAFPYTVYIIILDFRNKFETFRVYYRLSPITTMGDYLFKTNLLNVGGDNRVCVGSNNYGNGNTIIDICDDLIHRFWSSEFNDDIITSYNNYNNIDGVRDLLMWQYNSLKDPMFVFGVKWLKSSRNLSQAIDYLRDRYDQNSKNIFSMFNIAQKTDTPNEWNNFTDAFYISEAGEEISVGDTLILNKEELFVESLIGNIDTGTLTNIKFETDRGERKIIKITPTIKKQIVAFLKNKKYIESIELKNGVTIKVGDIIKLIYPFKTIQKVEKIRKSRNGNFEIRLNGEFYFHNIIEATLLDLRKPKFKDIDLVIDTKYILTSHTRNNGNQAIQKLTTVRFTGFGVENKDITLDFKRSNAHYVKIPLNKIDSYEKNISEIDTLIQAPKYFRMAVNIFLNKKDDIYFGESELLTDDIYLDNVTPTINDLDELYDAIIKENKIYIKGFDKITEFNVGDKVVVSNWNDPSQMLKVRTVVGFSRNIIDNKPVLNMLFKGKNEMVYHVPYLIQNNYNSEVKINIGIVRHIDQRYVCEQGTVLAGTKIRVKEAGISFFPKKDTNIVIGVLTDTNCEPFVLCSNCCTIWLSDYFDKFNHYLINTPEWKKYDHATIDHMKLNIQNGDMYCDGDGFPKNIIAYSRNYKNIRSFNINTLTSSYTGYSDSYTQKFIKDNWRRYGFINPRVKPGIMADMPKIGAMPNFTGGYTKVDTGCQFTIDERAINNV